MTYRDLAEDFLIDALNLGEVINELTEVIDDLPESEKPKMEETISTLKASKSKFEDLARYYGERINR